MTLRLIAVRLSIGLLVLAAQAVAPNPVAAAGTPAAPPTAPSTTHEVTLVTGDLVSYTENADGTRAARIDAADRPGVSFQTTTTKDGLFVYPDDVTPYLTSGVVDRNLFNVTELVREGLADTKTRTVPVLATYSRGLSAQSLDSKADELPSAKRHATVASTGGVGLRVDKATAATFWQSLATGQNTLGHGVSRLSLDRKVRVALDRSTRQVGAPAAWERGLDGTGTTVAVVDTGIDPNHPDLAGAVVESANFTDEPDTADLHGHGTHVASTIAGSGKASGGRYRGVAPGAKLVVAKVFDSTGYGETSQVMAGMEWAARRGVRVVNLSLGAGITDGSDPLSALVDTLSEETGALFVIAAGNFGPGDRTVTTPGTAASALTVGAVDKDNGLAWFSSRGPRVGDAMVKPEITAPGVDIVAARAAGTGLGTPVDESYTSSSGTSMATPHVAGAAALLVQQYPDRSAAALKNTLVTSAKDIGLRWYEQGAGLLDVARAVSQRSSGPVAANFGKRERVEGGTPAVSNPLAYTNTGDQPLTLDLSLTVTAWTGKPAPADAIQLETKTISVPPGQTASAVLALDPDIGATGVYGGTVVARSADGQTVLRTPVSAYSAPQLFPVDVRVLDSAGAPAAQATVQLIDDSAGAGNANDPFRDQIGYQVDMVGGTGRVALPAGSYSALGWTTEKTTTTRRWTGLSASEVDVRGPATITLDAAKAVQVGVITPKPTDQRDRTVMLRRVLPGYIGEAGLAAGSTPWQAYASPSPAAKRGAISLQDTLSLQQATVEVAGLHPVYDVPTLAAKWPGDHEVPVVFEGSGVAGKAVLARAATAEAANAAARTAAAAGAVALLVYVDTPNALAITGLTSTVLPLLSLPQKEGEALRAKLGTLRIKVRAAPDTVFNLSYLDGNGVPADHVRHVDLNTLVATKVGYHADKPGLTAQKTFYPFPTGLWKTQFVQGAKFALPGGWTEYTGPADDRVVWKRVVTASGNDDRGVRAALSLYQQNVYRAGERTRPDEHWFRAPMHSGVVELEADHPARYPATTAGWQVLCSMCRGGPDPDLFVPGLQWSDGSPGHFTNPYENGRYFATTTARLFQGDKEIPAANAGDPMAVFPEFRLDPKLATYRLEVVDAQPAQAQVGAPSAALFRHATRTETTWTFRSSRPASASPKGYSCLASDGSGEGTPCAFQPLIQLHPRFGLDLENRAPSGRFTFEVLAAAHSGAPGGPVIALRTAYSTDEGATWRDGVATPLGDGRWTVAVDHPAGGGFVWLRTTARDSTGNTVTQTVRRAYSFGG